MAVSQPTCVATFKGRGCIQDVFSDLLGPEKKSCSSRNSQVCGQAEFRVIWNRGTSGEKPMADELEELYRTTYPTVVRFLYRRVWDADRAQDLAQEVFMRLMAHRPEKPRAWLFAVAANLARDEARAAVRRKRHLTLLKDDPVTLPSIQPSAEDTVEQDERRSKVRRRWELASGTGVLLLWGLVELSRNRPANWPCSGSRWHDVGPGPEAIGRRI
jgi:hypothetical protein